MEKDLLKSENKLAANYHRTKMQKEMVLGIEGDSKIYMKNTGFLIKGVLYFFLPFPYVNLILVIILSH